MWLLNASTLKLEHFTNERDKYGRYAILSHVWLIPLEDEVTFQDVQVGDGKDKPGYAKIEQTCRKALAEKLDYVWIDTCCIDKTSSAELSQAINSMYRWYYEAKVCYAYLADAGPGVALKDSKWFTRGWTLQELIAPGYVEFYDHGWESIGIKHSLADHLAEITRIDIKVLRDRATLKSVSIAARMAWAAYRETSREEDRAYSLMGLFDVNMPMLYGEGPKAFIRLQEEIIRNSTDHSILAWTGWEREHCALLFSPDPFGFRLAHDILSWDNPGIDESYVLSNKGLRISLPISDHTFFSADHVMALLNCRHSAAPITQIALCLSKQPHGMTLPVRDLTSVVCHVSTSMYPDGSMSSLRNLERKSLLGAKWQDLTILREPGRAQSRARSENKGLWTQKMIIHNRVPQLFLEKVHPEDAFDSTSRVINQLLTGSEQQDRGYIVFGEYKSKKKVTLAFGHQIARSGVVPQLSLTRGPSTLQPDAVAYTSLAHVARVEFRKGVSAISAEAHRRQSSTGELEWVIELRLEHYSNIFKQIVQDRKSNKGR